MSNVIQLLRKKGFSQDDIETLVMSPGFDEEELYKQELFLNKEYSKKDLTKLVNKEFGIVGEVNELPKMKKRIIKWGAPIALGTVFFASVLPQALQNIYNIIKTIDFQGNNLYAGELPVFEKPAGLGANVTVYATVDDTAALVNALVSLTDENNPSNAYFAVTNDSGKAVVYGVPVGVDGKPVINLPDGFSLEQNYPNPWNPSTKFKYSVPGRGNVRVFITDLAGDRTKTLVDMVLEPGSYEAEWGGENNQGIDASESMYFYSVTHDGKIISKKMTKLGGGSLSSSNSRVGEPMLSRAGLEKIALQDKTYKLEVSNTDSINHEILPYLMQNIPISQDTTLYALLEKLYKSVKGNAETNDGKAVKNLGIKLVNDANTSLFYKALTDTLGKFSIDSVLTNQGIYTLLAIPNDSTNPAVFPKEWNNVYAGDSLMLVLQKPRALTGIITEFFSALPDSGALVKTSVDSGYTNADGFYSVLASFDREDVLVLKPNRLESGFIVEPGSNDLIVDHNIAKDDSSGGIDREFFITYILSNAGNGLGRRSTLPDSVYVSLTQESVPDTVWILGDIKNKDGYSYSKGFKNVAQLNEMAKKMNTMADSITNGLYNIDSTVIVIADSNFTHPDSVALFKYKNMVAVPNNVFPVDNEERRKKTLTIRSTYGIFAGNGTFFENLTVKGHTMIYHRDLPLDYLGEIFNQEFISSILGGVETPDDYPSVLRNEGCIIRPHDRRIVKLVIDRGPGRIFPDFPKDFSPEVMQKYRK